MSRVTFGGLASGLDTNHLIDQLVKMERQPIERKEKQIEKLEQTKDDWRDINMRLRHLRQTVGPLLDKNAILNKQAHSSDPAVVSAVAQPTAEDGTYEITVNQLATHHRVVSGSHVEDLGLGAETVNDALGLEGTFQFVAGEEEDNIVIEVKESDSLASIRDRINSSVADVEASIIDGYLILRSTVSGEEGAMEVVDGDGILEQLSILDSEGNFIEELEAQDVVFNINGVTVQRPINAVDDLIDGVTFHLESADPEQTVIVQVAADVESPVNALAAFVEQYNSVNDFAREKLGEDGRLQGDTTLMRIQRQLRSLVSEPVPGYRWQDEEGWHQKEYYSLASLGVTTFDKEGYLQFNEEKLVQAVREDPEAVYEVLRFEVKDEDGVGTGQYRGVAVDLDNYMKRLLENYQDESGRLVRAISVQEENSIQRRIDEIQRRIDTREERLLRYEERLIREFTALERFIATMNSQGEELGRMIDQLSGFGGQKQ